MRRHVDLVDDADGVRRDAVGHQLVAAADGLRGVDHEAHDVDVADRALGGGVEPLAERGAGLVDARRVDEHDLGVGPVEHPPDLGAGRLRLVRDDGHLGAEDAVEQRGLAHVGAADEGDEAAIASAAPPCSAGTRVERAARGATRTRPMRRPCTRCAVSCQPPTSTVSPSAGTWPSSERSSPPMVSQSPSGSSARSRSFTSSRAMRAFTRTSPPGSGSIIGSSTSNSSTISPTSSSMRSSSVTSPAVPPYSSTTIAMWNAAGLHLAQQLGDALGLGHEVGGARQLADGALLVAVALGSHEVLGVDDADDVVDALAADRDAAVAVEEHDLHRVGDPEVGGDGDHVGAGHHDLADDGVAELDDRLDEAALLGLDDLVLHGQVGDREELLLRDVRARASGPCRGGSRW